MPDTKLQPTSKDSAMRTPQFAIHNTISLRKWKKTYKTLTFGLFKNLKKKLKFGLFEILIFFLNLKSYVLKPASTALLWGSLGNTWQASAVLQA